MAKHAETSELPPLTDAQGEVREVTQADFARAEQGAPWTRESETARLKRALGEVIAAADRRDTQACRDIAARALAGEDG